jgi:hypothetical protein
MCCSNAGKFVNRDGIVDVDVRLIDGPSVSSTSYLMVTVSNTRASSAKLGNVDRLFIPFSSKTVKSGSTASSNANAQAQCMYSQPVYHSAAVLVFLFIGLLFLFVSTQLLASGAACLLRGSTSFDFNNYGNHIVPVHVMLYTGLMQLVVVTVIV